MRLVQLFSLLVVAAVVFLAISCGGGAEEEQSASPIKMKIELVYPESGERSKFAVLSPDNPFRIGADLNDPGDPRHSTHAIAEFLDEGEVVAEGRTQLVRFTTDPGNVDPDSREITVSGVPGGRFLDLNITLGRNINPNPDADIFEGFDLVFYTGSVNNLRITGSNVIIDGVEQDSVFVEMRTFNDGELFTVQFYNDFSSVPLVAAIDEMVSDEDVTALVSMSSLLDVTAPSPDATLPQLISDNVFDFQSMFFEITDLPISQAPYDVIVESGNHLVAGNNYTNFLLGGIVTAEELLTGNALLFDFETTVSRHLTRVHEVPSLGFATGNVTAVYNEMSKVHDRVVPLLEASPTGLLEVTPGDLALLELYYSSAQVSNRNLKLNFQDPTKFNTAVINLLNSVDGVGLNALYFDKGGAAPIKVVDSSGELLMFIPTEINSIGTVAADGNLITGGGVPEGSTDLTTLYRTHVGPSLTSEGLWEYIYSITDLADVGPLTTEEEEEE